MENGQEYVTIQEACELLGCGRTKIYTYYLNQELLEVKRKVGNRSFLLKMDVLSVRDSESGNEPNVPSQLNTHDSPKKTELSSESDRLSSKGSSEILLPPRWKSPQDSEKQIVTEYLSELKQRIHQLEHSLSEKDQLLTQYKSKLLNTVPLVEYSEKVKAKDQDLKNKEQKLQEQEEALKLSEQRTVQLEHKNEEIQQVQEDISQKLNKTLQIALAFQTRLDAEEQRKRTLEKLQQRWEELQKQLDRCGFFDFSKKRILREELEQVLKTLRLFH